jgi:hypothetical protein
VQPLKCLGKLGGGPGTIRAIRGEPRIEEEEAREEAKGGYKRRRRSRSIRGETGLGSRPVDGDRSIDVCLREVAVAALRRSLGPHGVTGCG